MLSFGLWYDTEAGFDVLRLEASTDGGSSWSPVPFTLRSGATVFPTEGTVSGFGGRRWHRATATLPAGTGWDVLMRWRYTNDAVIQGRGVYVDDVRVDDVPLPDSRFSSDGWQLSSN